MSQRSPPAQRSGEPSPSPAFEREQQSPGEATLRLLLYPCQHSPGSAPEGSGRWNEAARAQGRNSKSRFQGCPEQLL